MIKNKSIYFRIKNNIGFSGERKNMQIFQSGGGNNADTPFLTIDQIDFTQNDQTKLKEQLAKYAQHPDFQDIKNENTSSDSDFPFHT